MVRARYQQIPEASLKDREDDQLDEVRADDKGLKQWKCSGDSPRKMDEHGIGKSSFSHEIWG